MVRLKHRYLLFNVLYPSVSTTSPLHTTASNPSKQPAYIQFLRPSPSHLTPALLSTLLRAEIHALFGDHGLSVTQSSLRIIYFSPATSTGILRVPRAHFRLVWAALSFLTGVPKERSVGGRRDVRSAGSAEKEVIPCVIRVVRVSGTIRKSEEELLRRVRRDVVRAKTEEGDNVLDMFGGEQRTTTTAKPARLNRTEDDIIDLDDEEEDEDMDGLSG